MPIRRLLATWLTTVMLMSCAAPQPVTGGTDGADAVVYVIERGWHTDIGLPATEIEGPLASVESVFPGVRFLAFGFGERQFVISRDRSVGAMLSALLPSRSLVLVTALRTGPQEAFGAGNVVRLRVGKAGLDRIAAAVWREFEGTDGDGPAPVAKGPYPGSVFYAGRDTYSAAFTCNTWTATTLRAGGVAMNGTGVVFASQVMGMARWIAARHARQPAD